jgi:hypothetical protein
MKTTLVFVAASAGCFVGTAARADILVDNLSEPTRDVTALGTVFPDDIWAAQEFLCVRPCTLDSVELYLGNAVDLVGGTAELRSGEDPSGPAIATFALPELPADGVDLVALFPDVAVSLTPGVQYWLVLGTSVSGQFGWAYASGNNYVGEGAIGAYAYSSDMGVSWGTVGTDNPYQIRVSVSFATCPADFNGDNQVDFFDYLDFAAAFDAEDISSDFNGDNQVDFFDYLDFVQAFDVGCE